MPVALPSADEVLLAPPDAAESHAIAGAVAAAVAPPEGLTGLQRMIIESTVESMTGFVIPVRAVPPVDAQGFARLMARRDENFRTRMVQFMLLCALVLKPIPQEIADHVKEYARELYVEDPLVRIAERYAHGCLGLALVDFQRSGYMETWAPEKTKPLHTSRELHDAWEACVNDPALASQWEALRDLAPGTLGHAVAQFYDARGFEFPGRLGSAPPLLAQHDWAHVLADYGSTVESEIEVFAFISRANDDPRGFSLLAMVISLFETGYLPTAAGLFEADPGHLSREGMAPRLADALRRGALVGAHAGGPDLLAIDWFAYADRSIDDVRAELGVVEKSERALEAGSVGPWEPGGITPFQYEEGRRKALAAGREYDSYGATPA